MWFQLQWIRSDHLSESKQYKCICMPRADWQSVLEIPARPVFQSQRQAATPRTDQGIRPNAMDVLPQAMPKETPSNSDQGEFGSSCSVFIWIRFYLKGNSGLSSRRHRQTKPRYARLIHNIILTVFTFTPVHVDWRVNIHGTMCLIFARNAKLFIRTRGLSLHLFQSMLTDEFNIH